MARVVVTGAAGFVPAAVVRAQHAAGDEVLCWIRPGADTWRLPGDSRFLALDLRRCLGPEGKSDGGRALSDFGAEILVHGAWAGIRGAARDDPSQVENVAVTAALMSVAASAGVRRFVGLGSQAEYGPHAGPITEEAATRPTTVYGAAKLAAGHLALALGRRLGVSVAWARLFSVYGPGERAGTLIPDLAGALADHRQMPVGEGTQRWDYLFEDDAGTAIALLARASVEGCVNVGSGRPVVLREVMERVADLVGNGERPRFGERSTVAGGENIGLEADISRLMNETGFKPAVALDDGLARTVATLLGRPRAE